jgi:NADH-quinone oxidoreductase subunit J
VESVLGVTGNSQLVGETLYGNYLLPFEIASILLLVAIIGSVALAKKKTSTE